jgi:hypothetical protein
MTTADKAAGAIREALAAGPTLDWHQGPYGELHGADGRIVTFANAGVAFGSAYDHPEREANTRFLHAASPAALVAILDEMDRLRKDAQWLDSLERIEELLNAIRGEADEGAINDCGLIHQNASEALSLLAAIKENRA